MKQSKVPITNPTTENTLAKEIYKIEGDVIEAVII